MFNKEESAAGDDTSVDTGGTDAADPFFTCLNVALENSVFGFSLF